MAPSLAAELLAQVVDDNNVEYMARMYELLDEFDSLSKDSSHSLFQATSKSLADLGHLLSTTADVCSDSTRLTDLRETITLLSAFPLTVLRDPRNPQYGLLFAQFIETTDLTPINSITSVDREFWNSLTYLVVTGRHSEAYEVLSSLDCRDDFHFQYLRYILAQYPLDQGLPAFYAWRTLVISWERVLGLEIELATLRASGKLVKETILHEPFDMFETPLEDCLSYVHELANLLKSTIDAHSNGSNDYGVSRGANAKGANASSTSNTHANAGEETDNLSAMLEIAQIMLGSDTDAPSWWTKLSMLFYYTEPRESAMASHFTNATADYNSTDLSTWELGAQALFDDSIVTALDHTRQLDIPVAALLARMCDARGVLDRYNQAKNKHGGQYVVEQLSLEFAAQCLSNPKLVYQGLDILVHMRESALAQEWAQELLPRVLSRDLALVDVLASTANQMQLPELTALLLQQAAEGFLAVRDYADALQAYDQAADYATIQNTVWELFVDAIVSGDSRLALQQLASNFRIKATNSPHLKIAHVLSQVLVCLIEAVELNDGVSVTQAIDALMQLPQPPLRFRPLIVALVCGRSKSLLNHRNVKTFLDVLDSFEKETENSPIEASDKLLMQALLQLPQSDVDSKSIIWLLKRQLMKELIC